MLFAFELGQPFGFIGVLEHVTMLAEASFMVPYMRPGQWGTTRSPSLRGSRQAVWGDASWLACSCRFLSCSGNL